MLTGAQIRAGRAILGWSAKELAARSGLSYATIQRAESSDAMPSMSAPRLAGLKATMEAGGLVFMDAGDMRPGGPGVRSAT